jgi:hypothetical protein
MPPLSELITHGARWTHAAEWPAGGSGFAAITRIRGGASPGVRLDDTRMRRSTQRSDAADYVAGFSHTETCLRLSLVNGSRVQSLQRSRRLMPASWAIRSSSDGQT